VTCTLGGIAGQVQYAGPSSFVGVDQVNVALPRSLAGRGDVSLIFTADGKSARTLNVNFK
jgi:uncharacterized protein (TIGR03437 family)